MQVPIEPLNSEFQPYNDLHISKIQAQWGPKRQYLGGPFIWSLTTILVPKELKGAKGISLKGL